jgi:uncharacterized membrane protein YfcA
MQDVTLFMAGILVGAMNAIAGGGMLIGFPVLLAAGLPALAANITANIIVLPGSVASAYGYLKYLRKLPRQYWILLAPCLTGGAIGALILRNTSSDKFQQLVPLLVLFAVVLFAFQPLLHFHLHRHMRSKSKGLQPLLLICLALMPAAIYGGYFGAGFGFIMLAFLGFTKLHEMNQITGLKNLATSSIALTSTVCLFSTGLINWHYGLVMAAGGIIGGYYGALFTQKIPSHAVRIVIIVIGIVTTIHLGFTTYK